VLRSEEESEESMKSKTLPLFFAVAVLLMLCDQVLALHITHLVTPKNIDEQSFSFTVQARDVGEWKEFEITVRQKAAHHAPVDSATGKVMIGPSGKKQAAFPAITRVLSDSVQTYTFRLSPTDLDRATFTFTETPQDWRRPFAAPGDYWVFELSDFVASPRK
jgi:hypothetical protein